MDGKELYSRVVTTVQEMYLKIGDNDGSVSLYYPFKGDFETLKKEFLDASKDGLTDPVVEQLPERVRIIISESDSKRIAHLTPRDTLRTIVGMVNDRTSMGKFIETINDRYPEAILQKVDYIEFDYVLMFPEDVDPDIYCLVEEFGQVTYHRFSREDYLAFDFKLPVKE